MATPTEVIQWLDDFVHGFDFERPGVDRSLGRDIAHFIADAIAVRSATELRGGGPTPWKKNEPQYRDWKAKNYGIFDMPNFRTGQMLSHASLFGRTAVQARQVEMIYGVPEVPQTSAAPTGYLSPEDMKIEDVEKAFYAHNTHNRPFYELDDRIEREAIEFVGGYLEKYILEFP